MTRRTATFAAIALSFAAISTELEAQAASLTSNSTGKPMEHSNAVDSTRSVLEAYWKSHDPRYVAEDAVFVMMPTGEEIRGRDAIAAHLAGFYHGALDARAEIVSAIFGENKGLLEALVVGKHTGEFGGVPATGRSVKVPLAVSYELEGGLIKKARIYLMVNVLLGQITAKTASD